MLFCRNSKDFRRNLKENLFDRLEKILKLLDVSYIDVNVYLATMINGYLKSF